MADTPGSIVEIRAGASQRPLLELRPGQVVQPMSIGRVGMWAVDAPDVLDVHAYVYFDGNALFIQSADAQNPAKGNGRAIATNWQQIEIPCTIEMGRARLVYRTLDEMEDGEEDKTVAQAIQLPTMPKPQFTANAGAFSNRNKGPDSDATRLQPMQREPDPTVVSPLEMAGTPIGGVPKARPAAGMPAWANNDIAPQSSPTAIGAPPAPPPPQNSGYQAFGSVQVAVPPPPAAPNPMQQTLSSPIQSPMPPMQPMQGMPMQPGMMPQQMMMQPGMMQPGMMQPGMMPMAGQSGQMMALPPGSPAAETGRVVPPSELKGFARAKAEWNAMPPIRKIIIGTFPGVLLLVYFMLFDDEPQQQARRPRPQPSASASVATPASATTTAPPASTPPVVMNPPPSASVSVAIPVPTASATTTTSATAKASATPPPPKGKVTLEREAVDYVTQGQYVKAAEIYEQLAAQHPETPVYREAARILRARGNGG
jgi:hypothetical protein